jgi:DNA polymerase III delta prime subunit
MQPVFHPRTTLQLETFLKKPSHAVLLTGKEGSGKLFTAKWLASQLEAEYFVIESPEEKSVITIDQIRELYNFTRTGNKLAVIIKDSQELGNEAQNAFLKLLEEPPKNTTFILTAPQPEMLLSTIRSRTQHIEVLAPLKEALQKAVKDSADVAVNIESLLITSDGLAGTYISLVNDLEKYQLHQEGIEMAKKFYSGSVYQRHMLCVEHQYEKAWSQQLLTFLAVIIQTLIKQAGSNTATRTKLLAQAQLLEATSRSLFAVNGNPKIHLAKLCEQLG